jgi:hypothetical protein
MKLGRVGEKNVGDLDLRVSINFSVVYLRKVIIIVIDQ